MKKILLLLWVAILITGFKSYAQVLKATEMIAKSKCQTFECYNNFITDKGFSFKKSTTESNGVTYYLFVSDKQFHADNNTKVSASNNSTIGFKSADAKYRSVGIRTVSKSYYKQLLSDFKKLGYTELMTTPAPNNGVSTTYSATGKYPYLLYVLVETLEYDGEKYTSYNFTIL